MTIAALRRLLDEIDHQGGPDAAREWRLHLPNHPEGPEPMATAPELHAGPALTIAVTDQQQPTTLPVGQLLAWGDQHDDQEVRDQAARARMLLTGLRRRHAADQELAAITTEAEQFEARLAELRAREAELTPAKPKKARRSVDYPAATVRAWATANGVDCPAVGRVPKTVLDAWRAAGSPTA